MQKHINPATLPAPAGPYSQGILSTGPGQWLHIAGQIGVDKDGNCAQGMTAQAERAWFNLLEVLREAGMGVEHLVKVTTYVTEPSLLGEFAAVRAKYLEQVRPDAARPDAAQPGAAQPGAAQPVAARPASTLIVVKALARPEWLVEVEAVAFLPA
ncbi:RidA family protein [Candidimonas nitroreducens]|uniref:Enamine deaminase RidA n=1 Tax=Candidimonas nitroreducens TaxID=683354 RepID=A0A225M4S7_9BURK|nr:RidA family protein [Candidimonas nitroreducens]OWT56278.1 enamine deaminase RidA [Candidimonas nitroreducens]